MEKTTLDGLEFVFDPTKDVEFTTPVAAKPTRPILWYDKRLKKLYTYEDDAEDMVGGTAHFELERANSWNGTYKVIDDDRANSGENGIIEITDSGAVQGQWWRIPRAGWKG